MSEQAAVVESNEAFEFLKNLILELKDFDEDALTPESVMEGLELESLDYVETQVMVKRNFGVEISPDLFMGGRIRTLGEFAGYIESNKR